MQEGTLSDRIARFLFTYWNTPQTRTGLSQAELLFGRRLRSRLDLLKPDLYKRVEREQERQKEAHDRYSQDRSLLVGDAVYVRNFGRGPTWLAGQIVEQPGPRKYKIRLADDGIVWCKDKDHVRRRYIANQTLSSESL